MATIEEIQHLLERLSLDDRRSIERWFQEGQFFQGGEDRVEEAQVAYGSDPLFMTLEEFLAFEESSPIRHEYLNGAVYAMTGASVAHGRIKHNLVMVLGSHLGRGPCQVFSSDTQLRIQRDLNDFCYYPDIMVDCLRETWDPKFVVSPKLIVEILSPSTHLIDRREKLQNYRLIGSVEEYILVAQDERKLTIYSRANGWRSRVHAGLEAIAEFRSVELRVPLIEIYGDILDAG
jgi:Uma2 family endonuclease